MIQILTNIYGFFWVLNFRIEFVDDVMHSTKNILLYMVLEVFLSVDIFHHYLIS
jgi:hypothetical protein